MSPPPPPGEGGGGGGGEMGGRVVKVVKGVCMIGLGEGKDDRGG